MTGDESERLARIEGMLHQALGDHGRRLTEGEESRRAQHLAIEELRRDHHQSISEVGKVSDKAHARLDTLISNFKLARWIFGVLTGGSVISVIVIFINLVNT